MLFPLGMAAKVPIALPKHDAIGRFAAHVMRNPTQYALDSWGNQGPGNIARQAR